MPQKDTLDMMKALHAEKIGGVIHCFSYTKEMAREYLNMGFYLGIGGVVTFKNAKKLKEVVEYMPMEQMVLETDCPLSFTRSKPRQTQLLFESSVCGGGSGPYKGDIGGRGNRDNKQKRENNVQALMEGANGDTGKPPKDD